MPLVRSYRTLAPLPVRLADRNPQTAIGGVFLWHCPHGRPHRALPGRPGHQGARTFLNRPAGPWNRSSSQRATDRDHLACFPASTLPKVRIWSSGRLLSCLSLADDHGMALVGVGRASYKMNPTGL